MGFLESRLKTSYYQFKLAYRRVTFELHETLCSVGLQQLHVTDFLYLPLGSFVILGPALACNDCGGGAGGAGHAGQSTLFIAAAAHHIHTAATTHTHGHAAALAVFAVGFPSNDTSSRPIKRPSAASSVRFQDEKNNGLRAIFRRAVGISIQHR
ncbi:hypothetical protein RB195_006037 [Necator americanus]|uniref:Uncharacterized protein n=1 Tax=Necator americanus TaxID=51031 RepID=A0ABR1BU35_NECAM